MKFASLFLSLAFAFSARAESRARVEIAVDKGGATMFDRSFEDWAGAVLQAHLEFTAAAKISGKIEFIYRPKPGTLAVALKQSAGGKDLLVTGAVADFTDIEGRRILALTPGQQLVIAVPIETTIKAPGTMDILVELEPTEVDAVRAL